MYAEIVPLMRLPRNKRTFTYSIPSEFEGIISVGSFVQIPWRNKMEQGIVIQMHNNTPKFFKASPISKLFEDSPSWNQNYLDSLMEMSEYYYLAPATFLNAFAPQIPLKDSKVIDRTVRIARQPKMDIQKSAIEGINNIVGNYKNNNVIKFNNHAERLLFYRQLIAKIDGQILIVTFQQSEAIEINNFLEQYFKEQVSLWDNQLAKNLKWKKWQSIKDNKVKIIITTRSGVYLPCNNLKAIIIDQEDRDDHKSWESSPKYDARDCAMNLSNKINIPIFLLSQNPRIFKSDVNNFSTIESSSPPLRTIYHDKNQPILNEETETLLSDNISQGKPTIVCVVHKFTAQTLRCLDCQYQWKCDKCELNYSIKGNEITCIKCNNSQPIPTQCAKCSGVKIKSFGLGVAGMANHISDNYSDITVTPITAKDFEQISCDKSLVIVTTGFLLKRLINEKKIEKASVILFRPEELLYIPNHQSTHNLYQYINWHRITAKDYLNEQLLIQTSLNDQNPLFNVIQADDYSLFLKEETESRARFNYPPFSRILKISIKSSEKGFDKIVKPLTTALNGPDFNNKDIIGPLTEYTAENEYERIWLIKVNPEKPLVLDKLLNFAYSKITIEINPH